MMQRYLLRFSYQGTVFQGSQKNVKRLAPELWTEDYVRADRNTIQGALEQALVRYFGDYFLTHRFSEFLVLSFIERVCLRILVYNGHCSY